MKKLIAIFLLIIISLYVGYYFGYQYATDNPRNQNDTTNQVIIPAEFSNQYKNAAYRFSVNYPNGVTLADSFGASYMIPSNWSVFDPATTTGTQIVSFTLPNSNNITAAELRIGASQDAVMLTRCLESPAGVYEPSVSKTINTIPFTVYHLADAATSHYANVYSYRTIHNNNCFVIDVLVTGTNPEVYDPPTTTPFTSDYAFGRLNELLSTFRFE